MEEDGKVDPAEAPLPSESEEDATGDNIRGTRSSRRLAATRVAAITARSHRNTQVWFLRVSG